MIKGAQAVSISRLRRRAPKGLAAYGLARPRGEVIVRDKSNTLDLHLRRAEGHADLVCRPGPARACTWWTRRASIS